MSLGSEPPGTASELLRTLPLGRGTAHEPRGEPLSRSRPSSKTLKRGLGARRLRRFVVVLYTIHILRLPTQALTELPMAAIQQMTNLTTLWCAPRLIEPRARGLS